MWTPLLRVLLLVLEVVDPLVVLEIFQPLVINPLVRLLGIMNAPSAMPLIVDCLFVLVIISLTIPKILPTEILALSPLLLLLEFHLLLLPLLR